jgi:hypothetical protein
VDDARSAAQIVQVHLSAPPWRTVRRWNNWSMRCARSSGSSTSSAAAFES